MQLKNQANPEDQALYAELCYGTLRMFPRLNAQLSLLLKKSLKKQDADVRALLLIGLYQLKHMRIPDHAVLNQTVAAIEDLGKRWAKGLTNAILRSAQRQVDSLDEQLGDQTEFQTAHPAWLVEQWQRAWPKHLDTIVHAGNEYPPMSLRINRLQHGMDSYCTQLDNTEIEYQRSTISSCGLRLQQSVPVNALPDFFQGACSVQDEAPQLCAPLLDLQPSQTVLDACAAPGGKTGHLLECCPEIKLTALDISAKRLADVQSNLERLSVSAELIAADAAATAKWWDGTAFDRILLDAPCSGTGVIRRHPDIKVLRRPTDIQNFCQQQKKLLDNLWPLLAENGLLLYATCSIMPDENEAQILSFIQRHKDVEVMPIEAEWGIPLPLGRQILPSIDGPDGFYFALLRKTGES